jgi:hypothetical protein
MGQYYYVVNVDKKEFLHPHYFDDGLKLLEFGDSSGGTLTGLTLLLADNGDRVEEFDTNNICGRWSGDRIIIAGDYGSRNNEFEGENVHDWAQQNCKNISLEVAELVAKVCE